mmetsp:Transcript_106408/g.148326  ORF Transcript_106408/g.148326 Transcript_106408/m.148326 type:complete len:115 (-) Transcript_106408:428-772(-)
MTLYYIVIAHMMFAIWLYGVNDIFETSYSTSGASSTVSAITSNINTANSSVVSEFFTRVTLEWNLILFIVLLITIIVFILRGGLITCLNRTVFSLCKKEEVDAAKEKTMQNDSP